MCLLLLQEQLDHDLRLILAVSFLLLLLLPLCASHCHAGRGTAYKQRQPSAKDPTAVTKLSQIWRPPNAQLHQKAANQCFNTTVSTKNPQYDTGLQLNWYRTEPKPSYNQTHNIHSHIQAITTNTSTQSASTTQSQSAYKGSTHHRYSKKCEGSK